MLLGEGVLDGLGSSGGAVLLNEKRRKEEGQRWGVSSSLSRPSPRSRKVKDRSSTHFDGFGEQSRTTEVDSDLALERSLSTRKVGSTLDGLGDG